MCRVVNESRPTTFTKPKREFILNVGLALMPVQHVARAGWSPTKSLGTTYGRNAAAHVREVGFPPGINVWLDLEGVKSSSSHATVIDYCNAWIEEVEYVDYDMGFGALFAGHMNPAREPEVAPLLLLRLRITWATAA